MPFRSFFRQKSRRRNDDKQEGSRPSVGNAQPAISLGHSSPSSPPVDGDVNTLAPAAIARPCSRSDSGPDEGDIPQSQAATRPQDPSSTTSDPEDWIDKLRQHLQDISALPPFDYPPLPNEKCIRLLQLLPGGPGTFMRCRLIVRELTPDLKYQAISYCWDDPSVPEVHKKHLKNGFPVECNNALILVNHGLVAALTNLHEKYAAEYLWADGICINQNDLAERAQHVLRMDQIYANAELVLVWLGLDPNDSALAACTLIYETVNAAHEYHAEHGHFPANPKPETMRADIFTKYRHRGWSPVHELYLLKWFTRVWTQQEVGLAKNAMLLWGSAGINLSYVVEFACLRKAMLHFNEDEVIPGPEQSVFFQFLDIWCQYEAPDSWRSSMPCTKRYQELEYAGPEEAMISSGRILRLLQTVRTLSCTDPRDRIFAFLAHPFAQISKSADCGVLIRPDYGMSKEDVFIVAAKKILSEMKSLMLLSAVVHPEDPMKSDFPSWVPLWDDGTSLPPFGVLLRGRDLYFDASKSKTSDPPNYLMPFAHPPVKHTNSLMVTGVRLDQVVRTCGPFHLTDFERTNPVSATGELSTNIPLNGAHRILCAIIEHYSASSPSPYESIELALALTLIFGIRKGGPAEDHPEDLLASFGAYLADKKVPLFSGAKDTAPGYHRHYSFGLAVSDRKFFITSVGYFGAGPAITQEGDICCVLFGGRVPFVLRETPEKNGKYKLVGEAFIQGAMRGEVVDWWKQGKMKEETFEII